MWFGGGNSRRDDAATPLAERLTLIAGLLLSAAVIFLFVGTHATVRWGSFAPEALQQRLQSLRNLTDLLIAPLGTGTVGLLLLVLIRWWDPTALRVRLRLLSLASVFLLVTANLAVINPIEQRVLTADPTSAAFGSDLQDLLVWTWLRAACALGLAATLVLAHRAPRTAPDRWAGSALDDRHRRLLLLVGSATLFEGYDRFILSLALPYIGADLAVGESRLGVLLAVIRAGALGSIVFGRLADRYGRRRLLLVSILVYTVATAATGLSRSLLEFTLLQLVAVVFLTTELAVAQVVVAEELPPAVRGFGQGVLGATAVLGAGFAALLFPVMQQTSHGWRGMYLIGVVPLLIVAYLRRGLPETQRWQTSREQARDQARPGDLLRGRLRRRLLILTALAAVAAASGQSALSFASYRATTSFGWPPLRVSSMIIGAGAIGFLGYFLIGRSVDIVGRRLVGGLGLLCLGLAVTLFYQTERLFLGFGLITVSEAALLISITSLSTELFPTALRATARSWVANSAVAGTLGGLGLIAALGDHASIATVITAMGLAASLMSPLILALPETSRVELFEREA